MNSSERTAYTLNYLRANPGESLEQTAGVARKRGVRYFVHNGRLFRIRTDYEEVGRLEEELR